MKKILNNTLSEIGYFDVKIEIVLTFLVFLIAVFLVLYLIRKAIYKTTKIDLAKKYSIYSLIKYFILVFSFVIGLQILGFNLSVLMAGSAALLVGIGLGLQNLFSDFVSGIIILIDSTVKVDDIIEINGMVCKVQEINIRTTTVLTREDKYIILPNTDLTRNQLINWTHSAISSRFEVNVGVDYSSDVTLVMKILKAAVDKQKGILKKPEPFVRFTDFGESSLDFSIIFWSEEVFRVENIKSEMRIKIFELFNSNNITIPFPQRVVHHNK
ncbi:mechanosensitive ion channel domain-containing protein [uncultured Flavobacterium sp.]|jgi:small-conductance mechanosensitive channel|uniref:mechanosensitive ion channel family protein n=1 Tax=uncultured Flavobacterium sp. TaxID=165435 RepID=UPI0030CA26AE